MNIGRPCQVRRKIKFYGKANWDQMKSELNRCYTSDLDMLPASDPNQLWENFKFFLNSLSDKFIPSKIAKPKCDLQWLTKKIIKKIHKRDKLYHKCKLSKGSSNYSKLRHKFSLLKANTPKEIRQSYWSYLEDVIFSGDSQGGNNI